MGKLVPYCLTTATSMHLLVVSFLLVSGKASMIVSSLGACMVMLDEIKELTESSSFSYYLFLEIRCQVRGRRQGKWNSLC